MVLPVIVGIVVISGVYYAVTNAGDLLEQTEEEVLALIASGIQVIGDLGEDIGEGLEDIGEALGELGSDIGSSVLGLIRYLGIAVVEGMEDTYAYIAGKVGGKKVQITSSVTILGIFMFTAFYILARLPSGGDSE